MRYLVDTTKMTMALRMLAEDYDEVQIEHRSDKTYIVGYKYRQDGSIAERNQVGVSI